MNESGQLQKPGDTGDTASASWTIYIPLFSCCKRQIVIKNVIEYNLGEPGCVTPISLLRHPSFSQMPELPGYDSTRFGFSNVSQSLHGKKGSFCLLIHQVMENILSYQTRVLISNAQQNKKQKRSEIPFLSMMIQYAVLTYVGETNTGDL